MVIIYTIQQKIAPLVEEAMLRVGVATLKSESTWVDYSSPSYIDYTRMDGTMAVGAVKKLKGDHRPLNTIFAVR